MYLQDVQRSGVNVKESVPVDVLTYHFAGRIVVDGVGMSKTG